MESDGASRTHVSARLLPYTLQTGLPSWVEPKNGGQPRRARARVPTWSWARVTACSALFAGSRRHNESSPRLLDKEYIPLCCDKRNLLLTRCREGVWTTRWGASWAKVGARRETRDVGGRRRMQRRRGVLCNGAEWVSARGRRASSRGAEARRAPKQVRERESRAEHTGGGVMAVLILYKMMVWLSASRPESQPSGPSESSQGRGEVGANLAKSKAVGGCTAITSHFSTHGH